MNLIDIVNDNIYTHNLISNNDKLLVGVSGGPDSMCLLDILIKLKYNICVAHINHNLRDEAIIEQQYVEEFCKFNNISCFVLNADINKLSKENKTGTEEESRNVRYEFFNRLCDEHNLNKILVAHNKDDNLETILQNILRGCSLRGLSGMSFKSSNVIRPIINIYKKDILEYCKSNNIKYYIDKTNNEDIYLINKIRLQLIPLLEKEYNSNVKENILRLSNISRDDEIFLDKYTKNIVDKCLDSNFLFKCDIILNEDISIRKRCIREIILRFNGNLVGIENVHINDILKLLINNIKHKKYIIGNKFKIEIIENNIAKIMKGSNNGR